MLMAFCELQFEPLNLCTYNSGNSLDTFRYGAVLWMPPGDRIGSDSRYTRIFDATVSVFSSIQREECYSPNRPARCAMIHQARSRIRSGMLFILVIGSSRSTFYTANKNYFIVSRLSSVSSLSRRNHQVSTFRIDYWREKSILLKNGIMISLTLGTPPITIFFLRDREREGEKEKFRTMNEEPHRPYSIFDCLFKNKNIQFYARVW